MFLKVSHKCKWEGSRSCPLVTWFIFREQEGIWSSWYLAASLSNYIFLGPAASDLSFCLHLFLWELGPRVFLSSTKVSDSGHTLYYFNSLLVIGNVIILWKVQVFSEWLVYFQRVGGYFSLLISLFPPTHLYGMGVNHKRFHCFGVCRARYCWSCQRRVKELHLMVPWGLSYCPSSTHNCKNFKACQNEKRRVYFGLEAWQEKFKEFSLIIGWNYVQQCAKLKICSIQSSISLNSMFGYYCIFELAVLKRWPVWINSWMEMSPNP